MKSKDPDCKIPISKEEFRCFKCDYPSPKGEGGWKEIQPGLRALVCADCYKPKKDSHGKEEKEALVGLGTAEGSECNAVQSPPDAVRTSSDL
jgi:hypothetical protein